MPTILTLPPCFSYSSEYSAHNIIMLNGISSNPSKIESLRGCRGAPVGSAWHMDGDDSHAGLPPRAERNPGTGALALPVNARGMGIRTRAARSSIADALSAVMGMLVL